MHEAEMPAPRDLRFPCLVTVLALLLFLPELLFIGLLPRMVEMMSEIGVALPMLSRLFMTNQWVTFLFFVGLMFSTIFFAWCHRNGAIPASLSLLMQGIALGTHALACFLPWVRLANDMAGS